MTFKNPFTEKIKTRIKKDKLLTNYEKSPQWGHMSSGQKSLYKRYRRSAKERNKGFTIGLLHFCNLTESNCFYCGTEPKQKNGKLLYNGIDRVDNDKGYELGNVITCCGTCNKAKSVMGFKEFSEWIHRLSGEYKMRQTQLLTDCMEVEYFASRGFQINPKLYTLDQRKVSTYSKIDHGSPSKEYLDTVYEIVKVNKEY